jgi:hypothetical protein
MWPIVRDAFAGASPAIKQQFRLIVAFWVGVVLLQAWDSRIGVGAAGVAEFLSAVLGSTGVALLGVAHTLHRTMAEAASTQPPGGDARGVQQVLLALPALGFAAGVTLGAAAMLMLVRAILGAELPLAIVGGLLYSGAVIVAGLTVSGSARTLFTHATRNAAAAANARTEAAAAHLSALQARMNPHFLFNALNTVAALVRSNPRAAEGVVENLADVLRLTLARSAETMSSVRAEVEYVRAYLALEQERWGDRLRVSWEVEEAALDRPLPPLVLQPLVENAVRHGIGESVDGGAIHIRVSSAGDGLLLSVSDDGRGFARGWKEGTGLGNLRQRLQTLYGGQASLTVSDAPAGSCVTVELEC